MVAVDSRLKLKTDRFPQAKLRFPAGSVRSIGELVRLAEFTSTRRRFRRQALACVLGGAVLSIAAAFAEIPPPVVDESISNLETAWRAVTKPSEGLAMGPLRIAYEETTLPEVMSAIKSGSIKHQGDAAASVYWLCYTALNDGGNVRIWIEASGEMGGPEHAVTEVAVQRIARGRPPPECPALPKLYELLSFNNGVWLGAPVGSVEKIFHSRLLRSGDQAFVGYQGKVTGDGHCDGRYDLLNSLYLTFKAGLVVAITAGQVTSC